MIDKRRWCICLICLKNSKNEPEHKSNMPRPYRMFTLLTEQQENNKKENNAKQYEPKSNEQEPRRERFRLERRSLTRPAHSILQFPNLLPYIRAHAEIHRKDESDDSEKNGEDHPKGQYPERKRCIRRLAAVLAVRKRHRRLIPPNLKSFGLPDGGKRTLSLREHARKFIVNDHGRRLIAEHVRNFEG